MRLSLVRHGETEDNLSDILTGHRDGVLTPLGIQQAHLLGERLRNENFDVIFSSDLGRARQTTEEILQYHDCKVICLEILRETCYGEFEGKSVKSWMEARSLSGVDHFDFKPPNGESYRDVQDRIKLFLPKLSDYQNSSILISSHSDFNRLMFKELLGLSFEECRKIPQDNACLSVFEGSSVKDLKLLLQGETSHCAKAA